MHQHRWIVAPIAKKGGVRRRLGARGCSRRLRARRAVHASGSHPLYGRALRASGSSPLYGRSRSIDHLCANASVETPSITDDWGASSGKRCAFLAARRRRRTPPFLSTLRDDRGGITRVVVKSSFNPNPLHATIHKKGGVRRRLGARDAAAGCERDALCTPVAHIHSTDALCAPAAHLLSTRIRARAALCALFTYGCSASDVDLVRPRPPGLFALTVGPGEHQVVEALGVV